MGIQVHAKMRAYWKVEVEISGDKLDNIGMVVDFLKIRKATNHVVDELDVDFE